ncbi:hypothetical protein CFOL_v3_21023 [Cephalotus follicularis]|uniref:Uncharacterized protein n=1 Tax=Cephalotus follicularis TaxID=3775 RepID=A0A1Q3CBR9_CEPFO|nr:hypothetical protein CFOL_v3_21023 [Cephalotus follicularis]
MANIRRSIELEPRTLNQGQLHHVREVAAGAVQKMEPKEGSATFERGAVIPVMEMQQMEAKRDLVDKFVKCTQKAKIDERPCQCSCNTNDIECLNQMKLGPPF